MADAGDEAQDSVKAKSDAIALAEQAEAEAAEAEALAAAARARARAIKLRREAEAERATQSDADDSAETTEADNEADNETAKPTDEAEPAEKPEEAKAPNSTESAVRRLRVPNLAIALTIAAAVAIVGLLAVSGWMIYQHHNVLQRRQSAAAYVATARQGVINLTSLDYNKANESVQRVLDIATGEFRDDFQKRAADFTDVVKDSKAVTEGTVAATGLESMNKDSAVVLVLAYESVTNVAGAKDEPRTFRFRVTVVHDSDELKVSKVEFVL